MRARFLQQMIILSGFFLLSNHIQAEIYKCKDGDGVINFTSVPCGEKANGIKRPEKKAVELNEDGTKKSGNTYRILKIISFNKDGTKKSGKQIIAERLKKEKEFLEAAKRQKIDEKKKSDKLEKHNNKIEQNCKRAKQDLNRYQRSQYLYTKDESGKKVILTDAQRKKAELDSQRRITYWCRK